MIRSKTPSVLLHWVEKITFLPEIMRRRGAWLGFIHSSLAAKLTRSIPYDWLRDVLFRLPDHPVSRVAELLPHRWKPADCHPH